MQKNIRTKAESETNNEEHKKNLNILQQLRASQEEKLKMEAKNEFYKSNEYDQLFKERVENEIKAARTQKEIEQNDLYEKSLLHAEEMKLQQRIKDELTE